MSQPVQNLLYVRTFLPGRQDGTVNHQHWQAQRACGVQLGASALSARVFGHNQVNPVPLQQLRVARDRKRTTRHDHLAIRKWQRARFVYQSQQIVMLGLGRKTFKMHPANCQKHALGLSGKCRNCSGDVGHAVPAVPTSRFPRGAGQRQQWRSGVCARRNRISAHLSGKWMRCVHDVTNIVLTDVACQALGPTKSADASCDGLRPRVVDTTRIGIGRGNTRLCDSLGQCVGLGRAAEDQKVRHV